MRIGAVVVGLIGNKHPSASPVSGQGDENGRKRFTASQCGRRCVGLTLPTAAVGTHAPAAAPACAGSPDYQCTHRHSKENEHTRIIIFLLVRGGGLLRDSRLDCWFGIMKCVCNSRGDVSAYPDGWVGATRSHRVELDDTSTNGILSFVYLCLPGLVPSCRHFGSSTGQHTIAFKTPPAHS